MPSPPENLTSHTFPQTVWRVLPHPTRDKWAIELRDPGLKAVSWALLDLEMTNPEWQVAPDATDWWSTLIALTGDKVYLHNYRYPDIPEPTDLLALALPDGALQWVLPGWAYAGEWPESGCIVVAQKQPETILYRFCDPRTGLLKEIVDELAMPAPPEPGYRAPVRYAPQDIYFDVLSSFLKRMAGIPSPLAIDYLESDPYVVFSYYLYEREKVAQYLLIANRGKDILYHQQLGENRGGVGRDTILWKANRLVCLRNSNEIISIKLTP